MIDAKYFAAKAADFYSALIYRFSKFIRLIANALRGHVRMVRTERMREKYPDCVGHSKSEEYKRVKPLIFDRNDYIKKSESMFHTPVVQSPEAWVHEIEGGYVAHEGLVITLDGSLIAECVVNRHRTLTFGLIVPISPTFNLSFYNYAEAEKTIEGRAAILSQCGDENYGHWLVESLPRLLLIERAYDISALKIILIDRNDKINNVYVQSLAFLGVNPANIVWYKDLARVDRVIYASPVTIHPWIKSRICVEALERIAQAVASDGMSQHKKIYISRNVDSPNRKMMNDAEIIEIVRRRGYEIVNCGNLTFEEQVRMFSGATHIVGNLGAGFTNLAFSPRGVRILALMSPLMEDDFFYDLVSLKEGHYWAIHGDGCGLRQDYRDDFTINPERFSVIFAQFDTDSSPSMAFDA